MSTSAGDIINGALRLLGMLAEGETPSANTSTDALAAMNQMLDSWNTERTVRELREVQLYDVSVVTFPAYEQTVAEVRSRNYSKDVEQVGRTKLRLAEVKLAQLKYR